MVTYGALVIGQVFHVKTVLNNAAREGARYLSLHPTDNTLSYSGTKAAAMLESKNSGVALANSDITVSPPWGCRVDEITGFCEAGFPVAVQVGTTYGLAWEWLFASTVLLVSEAQMMVP